MHGTASAARFFTRKLGEKVSDSTVQYIKKDYTEELKKRRASQDGEVDIRNLPLKKRGRPFLLGEDLDTKLQLYLKKVREGGGAVSTRQLLKE